MDDRLDAPWGLLEDEAQAIARGEDLDRAVLRAIARSMQHFDGTLDDLAQSMGKNGIPVTFSTDPRACQALVMTLMQTHQDLTATFEVYWHIRAGMPVWVCQLRGGSGPAGWESEGRGETMEEAFCRAYIQEEPMQGLYG